MKKQIYTFVGILIVLTVSSVSAVRAQAATSGRAHIPFDFNVKNRTMAAGDYLINRQDDRGMLWSLTGGADNRQSALLLTMDTGTRKNSGKGKMTFRRHGNKYFLAAIETSIVQIEMGKSRAERRLEKQLENDNRLAKNNVNDAKPEIVVVEIGT